jgi:hypothetical protein
MNKTPLQMNGPIRQPCRIASLRVNLLGNLEEMRCIQCLKWKNSKASSYRSKSNLAIFSNESFFISMKRKIKAKTNKRRFRIM